MTQRRKELDVSAYLVVGPENTRGRGIACVIKSALTAGFTCIQIRSKTATARELIGLTDEAAKVIDETPHTIRPALLVNDRLDVALAAKMQGIPVDGVHVGQSDIPPEVCRTLLGEDAIVGLSARSYRLLEYVRAADVSGIDYFGAGPLHETETKPEAGVDASGRRHFRTVEELTKLASLSPIPVVVGGGVKAADLPELAKTGVDGFFVVSAVAGADNPYEAARELTETWRRFHGA